MRAKILQLRALGLCAASALVAGDAHAQSFNLDVGPLTPVGSPTVAYAAAAGQPGHWFALSGGPPYAFALTDIHGNPTGVTVSCSVVGSGMGDFYFNNIISTRDHERLIDDCQDIGPAGTPAVATWTFSGLQNGGYRVFTYAIAPDNSTYRTAVTPQGANQTVFVGGVFPNGHLTPSTFARHCVEVTNGVLTMELTAAIGRGTCNGFQLLYLPFGCDEAGSTYCTCRTMASAPCSNPGATDRGCAHSQNLGGAQLLATGTTNPDTIVLRVLGGVPGQPGLFFQGNNQVNGGNGIVFGDGLRCAGGGIVRLQVRVPDSTGRTQTTVSITVKAGLAPGDGPRYYQYWYRDPAGHGMCQTGFNLTNGYQIVW